MSRSGRSRRPSITSPCVADRHAGSFERIAEFHFPRSGLGGLLSLRETDTGPCIQVYRTDDGVTVVTPKQKYWAAYVGTANGSAISLHTTRRDALETVAASIWGDQPEEDACDCDDPQPHIPHGSADADCSRCGKPYRPTQTDDELEEAIRDHCDSSPDDWEIQEVETP